MSRRVAEKAGIAAAAIGGRRGRRRHRRRRRRRLRRRRRRRSGSRRHHRNNSNKEVEEQGVLADKIAVVAVPVLRGRPLNQRNPDPHIMIPVRGAHHHMINQVGSSAPCKRSDNLRTTVAFLISTALLEGNGVLRRVTNHVETAPPRGVA